MHLTKSLATTLSLMQLEDRSMPAVWPVPSSHSMLNGFGAGIQLSTFKFHEGIDIRTSGNGGEKFVAARAGIIFRFESPVESPLYKGIVTVEVTPNPQKPANKEYDSYIHVVYDNNLVGGAAIAEGALLGTIARVNDTGFPAGAQHLHFMVTTKPLPAVINLDQQTILNPLLRFTGIDDRDPRDTVFFPSPDLRDTNGDGRTLLVRAHNGVNPFLDQTINGDIDLIADAVDPMSTTLRHVSVPYSIGYYVKPLFDQGAAANQMRGVARASSPYMLARFDDAWFGNSTPQDRTSSKLSAVYDTTINMPVRPFPFGLQQYNNFIVTNTTGFTGDVRDVSISQYWNTDAKEDGGTNWTNYSDRPNAANNGEARFKDGDYEVHIPMSDLRASFDRTAGKLRLVNFTRTADTGKGGVASNQGLNGILYSQSSAPWVPEYKPDLDFADTAAVYTVGDIVGAKGTQYYPGSAINAYIVPHKPDGWKDGDDITANRVAWAIVDVGNSGEVSLTQVWQSAVQGEYDLVLDYDNDLKFSWKLDGLTGFHVVPAPGAIGDRVWIDSQYASPDGAPPNPVPTGDGIQASGELGFGGIVVHLQNVTGQEVAVTTTSPGGGYLFGNLVPGTYRLKFDLPSDLNGPQYYANYSFSPKDALGTGTPESELDSDADASGLTEWFVVTSGQTVTSADAGIVEVAWTTRGRDTQGAQLAAADDETAPPESSAAASGRQQFTSLGDAPAGIVPVGDVGWAPHTDLAAPAALATSQSAALMAGGAGPGDDPLGPPIAVAPNLYFDPVPPSAPAHQPADPWAIDPVYVG